jgi:hypothetical protein
MYIRDIFAQYMNRYRKVAEKSAQEENWKSKPDLGFALEPLVQIETNGGQCNCRHRDSASICKQENRQCIRKKKVDLAGGQCSRQR